MPVELLARLFHEVPAFTAYKCEVVPAGAKYSAVLAATGNKLHVSGGWAVMQMIEGLERGVHAFMPTSLHRTYVEIYKLYHSGDVAAARRLHESMLPILCFSNQHLDVSIHFFKRLLHAQKIYPTGSCREPMLPLDPTHARIAAGLIDRALDMEEQLERDQADGMADSLLHQLAGDAHAATDTEDRRANAADAQTEKIVTDRPAAVAAHLSSQMSSAREKLKQYRLNISSPASHVEAGSMAEQQLVEESSMAEQQLVEESSTTEDSVVEESSTAAQDDVQESSNGEHWAVGDSKEASTTLTALDTDLQKVKQQRQRARAEKVDVAKAMKENNAEEIKIVMNFCPSRLDIVDSVSQPQRGARMLQAVESAVWRSLVIRF